MPGRAIFASAIRIEFTDPIFSFGVFFAMKEAEFAAEAIVKHLGEEGGTERIRSPNMWR